MKNILKILIHMNILICVVNQNLYLESIQSIRMKNYLSNIKKILRKDFSFFGHNEKKNNYLLQEQSNRKTTKIITITTAPGKTIGVKSKGKNTSLLDN